MQKKIYSIAIDGPAGVGKSTVSKLLAKKLGWNCLDTGALYRGFCVKCLELNIDCANESIVKQIAFKTNVDVKYINNTQHIIVDGKDVTDKIRTEQIDKNVSLISKIAEVRDSIKQLQRDIATQNNVVVEGRDIGTVVLHDTCNKFFLIASPEVRAKRRYDERKARGENVDINEILTDIKFRDKTDSERAVSPLKQADDAHLIDTDNLSIDEVVDAMYNLIKKPEQIKEK